MRAALESPVLSIWHLAELAAHRDHPRDYDTHLRRRVELARADVAVAAVDRRPAGPAWRRVKKAERLARSHADRYPEWVIVRELAGLRADDPQHRVHKLRDGEDSPFSWHALEFVIATVFELES